MGVKALVYSAASYEIEKFERAMFAADSNASSVTVEYFSGRLTTRTAALANSFEAVVVSHSDQVGAEVLNVLARNGVRLVAVRTPSVSNVDLQRAHQIGMRIARVPILASHSVAEYAVALVMSLVRNTHKAYSRVRDGNLDVSGLVGFELHGETVGIIGTGKAGALTARILKGFGCRIVAYDVFESPTIKDMGGKYLPLEELLSESHVVSLHAPLLPATRNMISADTVRAMRTGAILINTSKSGLLDVQAVLEGLKGGKIAALGWDVSDGDTDLFRLEPSGQMIAVDEAFKAICALPNVIISGHQAAHTDGALEAAAQTTLNTLLELSNGRKLSHEVRPER
eukprot:Plantae.Rhodophyta-Rhodochaete_pulchella.ctg7968.p1 GENE.Plantae.Rhodophyta-Rhodochaete_pulchella.ctg7968~~Plantae.Rhodophyta-Rhodochaete_pulchella.ctg7968.p1  ORF type:complete len:341 (+),score=48.29 Plantae.Rhodophyta-Rhodochaete_pulchella.ctg7968:554-1576(+)